MSIAEKSTSHSEHMRNSHHFPVFRPTFVASVHGDHSSAMVLLPRLDQKYFGIVSVDADAQPWESVLINGDTMSAVIYHPGRKSATTRLPQPGADLKDHLTELVHGPSGFAFADADGAREPVRARLAVGMGHGHPIFALHHAGDHLIRNVRAHALSGSPFVTEQGVSPSYLAGAFQPGVVNQNMSDYFNSFSPHNFTA